MARKNRNTLKNYFRNGSVPSQDQFEDLVDSTLNIIDEGFDKTLEDGLKLSQFGNTGKLMSFYKDSMVNNPLYFLNVDQDDNLVLSAERQRSVLFLPEDVESDFRLRVGINTDLPENELHVGGVIRSEGRIGVASRVDQKELEVPADGKWHDITGILTGCHAYEVMAGVGGRKTQGRYALVHAVALNAFNPKGPIFNFLNLKKRIKPQHSYYRSRSDKLRLRWNNGEGRAYSLQIKTNSNFGDGIQIRYYLTRLWFDEDMSDSRSNLDGDIG